jgi:hypothetical protein
VNHKVKILSDLNMDVLERKLTEALDDIEDLEMTVVYMQFSSTTSMSGVSSMQGEVPYRDSYTKGSFSGQGSLHSNIVYSVLIVAK